MSAQDAREFQQFLEDFRKYPILPEQNTAILKLMIDGVINRDGAKKLLKIVIDRNIEKYKEFVSMSEEEITELFRSYGLLNEQ